jgi:hypothetical protein
VFNRRDAAVERPRRERLPESFHSLAMHVRLAQCKMT